MLVIFLVLHLFVTTGEVLSPAEVVDGIQKMREGL